MKYIFLLLVIFSTLLSAKEYKAVFDCSSKNVGYVASRMFLIERTMDMMQKNGDSTKFALTIHGSCAAIVSVNFDELVEDNLVETMQQAQNQLKRLSQIKDVEVIVCAMSLNANAIDEEDVVSFVKIVENSFIDTIGYQNDGYALMTFK
ncbi:MAG: DsrE family protein [Sulfurimonas sp.]|nr:DsrE family protein [Sulfurimonas sp.]